MSGATDSGHTQEAAETTDETEDDRVDPENLPSNATPALVQISGQGPVYVADHSLLSSGWIRVREWRDRAVKLPPHRVNAVQNIRTEYYGEPDDRGYRSKRVADDEWREEAKETDAAVPGQEVRDDG